ncbi:MAG TPA: cytochrome b/b6 domain-containing protein [Gallionellaceae bacterium]
MGHTPESGGKTIKVWDLPTRLFHWTLVLGFASAYLTAEYHYGDIHTLIGYGLCILLAARVYMGLFGSRYTRFSSFIFSPGETIAYMRSMFGKHPVKHYLGHNPAGALMVFSLLGVLTAIFTTGLLTLATIDFEGPLLALERHFSDEASYAVRELHEFLSNATLALVVLHLGGVVGGSIQHGENLVRAMITGNKREPSHPES